MALTNVIQVMILNNMQKILADQIPWVTLTPDTVTFKL